MVTSLLGMSILLDYSHFKAHRHRHMKDLGEELRFHVDLDAERGQQSSRADNTFRVAIKRTARLELSQLQSYLDGRTPMDETVISAITFLDHLLRQTPSRVAINVRRSYFSRHGIDRTTLGQGVEAMKGVYQSMRAAQVSLEPIVTGHVTHADFILSIGQADGGQCRCFQRSVLERAVPDERRERVDRLQLIPRPGQQI